MKLNLELRRITIDCPTYWGNEGVDLKTWLAEQAEKDGRSLSNFIIKILSDYRTERESHANN